MIEISKLSYSINNEKILEDITSVFHKGEIVGVIGKSGCGKTMLLKIIAGLLKNYSGEIFIKKKLLSSIHIKDITKLISLLPGIYSNDMTDDTVFNFLLQSRKLHKKILNPFTNYDFEIVEDYIKQFHLADYTGKKLLTLPSSIARRAFLASPFIKEAEILLLDDPTTSLDIESISLLQNVMLKYVINGDKTIIIAGNDINFIFQTADRILFMKGGKIEHEAFPKEIDSEIIKRFISTEVLVSRNIYTGKPIIHLLNGGEG